MIYTTFARSPSCYFPFHKIIPLSKLQHVTAFCDVTISGTSATWPHNFEGLPWCYNKLLEIEKLRNWMFRRD